MASERSSFVSLGDFCPQIMIEASYATKDNFTGEVVAGYLKRKALLSKLAAISLCEVQKQALEKGLSLKVFDGYRPVKGVYFFQDWAKKKEENSELKKRYYPKLSRLELFEQGYIAKKSSHSRGSAIDLTLFDLKSKKELDMGAEFDYFDKISWTDYSNITSLQKTNRKLLRTLMEEQGFQNYHQEWWHFSLIKEPFPETYFNFDVD